MVSNKEGIEDLVRKTWRKNLRIIYSQLWKVRSVEKIWYKSMRNREIQTKKFKSPYKVKPTQHREWRLSD